MSKMKSVSFYAAFNERTGYGVHASRFGEALEKLLPVHRNQPGGDVAIVMADSVSIQNINQRPAPVSILYNVWESTSQPQWFIDRLKHFDQLWVASEWQRAASIAQGIPEEFVKVVPEGVDPEVYKPGDRVIKSVAGDIRISSQPPEFTFLHVGQWQPRKSTIEIIQSFLKAFPDNQEVRLYLSADTLFPSDNYKSTEERLEAYGLEDPRIIPVHFEERDAYVRRLQSAHAFVSCSRSEGWFLPGIEAVACGIPSIFADFGGSTEYSAGCLNVRIRELRKPFGIYGNWDVPGYWGEPDYDHLAELMRDVYENYPRHKEKALKTSEMIRTKFSWDAAAKKAYDIMQQLSTGLSTSLTPVDKPVDKEEEVRSFARKHGYEITSMRKQSVIFTVDCHPTTKEKLDTLTETIKQIKGFGYPVLVASHVPLSAPVVELADFYIYDKRDVLSPPSDMPVYWRRKLDGTVENAQASIPCHAVASTMNVRNAIDFCLGKYDWVYHMCYDTEVDLEQWLAKVKASDKVLIGTRWDHQENTFSGQLFAGRIEVMDKIIQHVTTWEEFVKINGDRRFNSEEVFLERIAKEVGMENVEILDMDLGNRYDQVDRNVWEDEEFQFHFAEGPFFNIIGLSNREYDVTFNDGTRDAYTLKQKSGSWSRPSVKYYKPWTITARLDGEVKFQHTLDLKGKRVLISMGSKALGDTIAWMPYVEEFRKKHGCHIICSGWWKHIFDYPEIEFVNPGTGVENIYAAYSIGCFDGQLDMNVTDWRLSPLQKVSADILGIDYEPIRAKLKYEPHKKGGNGKEPKPYVCFSEFSTMKCKLWNRPGAWQKVIDYLVSLGYDCVSVSVEKSELQNVIRHNGQPIESTITDVSGCEFYIGLNAGPSWIAYALDKPCIMVTGVSEEWNDFPNPYRVAINHAVCGVGCFNDPALPIDRGWEWCPRKKDYACTKEITEGLVMKMIDKIRGGGNVSVKKGKIKRSRVGQHKRDDGVRPPAISSCGRSHEVSRPVEEGA